MFILWLRGSWFRYRDYINMKCLEEKYCTIYNEWFKSSTCYFSPPEMKWFYKAFSRIVYHLDQVSIKALFVRGGGEGNAKSYCWHKTKCTFTKEDGQIIAGYYTWESRIHKFKTKDKSHIYQFSKYMYRASFHKVYNLTCIQLPTLFSNQIRSILWKKKRVSFLVNFAYNRPATCREKVNCLLLRFALCPLPV